MQFFFFFFFFFAVALVPQYNGQAGESGASSGEGRFTCDDCTEGNVLAQYANTAGTFGLKTTMCISRKKDA